ASASVLPTSSRARQKFAGRNPATDRPWSSAVDTRAAPPTHRQSRYLPQPPGRRVLAARQPTIGSHSRPSVAWRKSKWAMGNRQYCWGKPVPNRSKQLSITAAVLRQLSARINSECGEKRSDLFLLQHALIDDRLIALGELEAHARALDFHLAER